MMTDKEVMELVNKKTIGFRGLLNELEGAIGMLIVGRHFGWKVLLLIHDKKTIKKYETILGIDIRVDLPEVGKHADKSVAWVAVQKIKSFWKAVKGEEPGIRSQKIKLAS